MTAGPCPTPTFAANMAAGKESTLRPSVNLAPKLKVSACSSRD